jgi:regulatory protein
VEEQPLPLGIITKVERQARMPHRYNLHINDQYAISVHEDIMIKHRLFKGEEIDAPLMQAILLEEEQQKSYLTAVRLLSSRLRSEHEIKTRLKQKGFTAEIINHTVKRLSSEGYLNDTLFAEQLTTQRIHSQKKGRNFIKQELQQKGLSKDRIQEAMSQVDSETEYKLALGLAKKKYRSESDQDPSKARRKMAGFLARRGYPGSVVSRVLRELKFNQGAEEEEWSDFVGDDDDLCH